MDLRVIIQKFCSVIECQRCSNSTILRDSFENIPQPGYIGKNYDKYKLLLIGQNPGICPTSMKTRDLVYMESLKNLKIYQDINSYEKLYQNLLQFVPEWPVQKNYFPLQECGLGLEDIGYCNTVRCRTVENRTPSRSIANECINRHLIGFINTIQPRIIVCIGKWAYDKMTPVLSRSIPIVYMNRDRSLNGTERLNNRKTVIEKVKSNSGFTV